MKKIVAMALMGISLAVVDCNKVENANAFEDPRLQNAVRKVPQYQCELVARAVENTVVQGEDIVLNVEVRPLQKGDRTFSLGSLPQVFGIYVLGPWGVVEPDIKKVRPENWMHQQHSAAANVKVSSDQPYKTIIKLSDYFSVDDVEKFREGEYQINVKFFVQEIGMVRPVTSKPVKIEVSRSDNSVRAF